MTLRITQIVFFFCFFQASSAYAQEDFLHPEQVLEWVKNYHPVVKQANLGIRISKSEIVQARASFDPFLTTYISQKTFNGIDYYRDVSPELKLPTWIGADIIMGTENYVGSRLDPSLSEGQSSYLGVNVPLVKNLIIDKRRAYLKQAKIFRTISENEQEAIVNDINIEAMNAYWNWVKAFRILEVTNQNVLINQKRFEFIKRSFENGEKAAIDTIEAAAQLQNFLLAQIVDKLEFQNTGLMLSSFLWLENDKPYQLPNQIIPTPQAVDDKIESQFQVSLNQLLEQSINHPELKAYHYKLDILKIDKKLKFQELLPVVNFRYNFLSKDLNIPNRIQESQFFENNYQYGLKFEMPLRLSQGRASYQIAKLKIDQTNLAQNQKKLEIEIKVKTYFNEFIGLQNQLKIQKENFKNYSLLLKAEETKLKNGESSLFLINSRETKAQEANQKLIDLQTKYYQSIYKLQWSAGLLR
jgi:outer membrane protein TolC